MGRKGTPFPYTSNLWLKAFPQPQIVIMLGKDTQPLSGAQT